MFAASAQTQQSTSPVIPAPQSKITIAANIVKLDVSVSDPHGNFLEGLQKDSFHIYDDGAEQPITFFAPTDAPAQILVLVETGPAVFLIHRQHLDAAYALLSGLAPDDQVALATYADQPHLLFPFTSNKDLLAQSLEGLQYELGSTNLNFYDAVSACMDWLGRVPGKKALLLLTTGLDSSPPGHRQALENRVRSNDITIFAVALGGSLRSYDAGPSVLPKGADGAPAATPGLSFRAADAALNSLAELSGGQAFFPKKDNEFIPIYHRIVAALRSEYTIGFAPAHDGKFHSIRIETRDEKGRPLLLDGSKKSYRVLAREGYHAPGPGN